MKLNSIKLSMISVSTALHKKVTVIPSAHHPLEPMYNKTLLRLSKITSTRGIVMSTLYPNERR